MRNKKLGLLFIISLILAFGLTTVAFAGNGGNKKKKQKRPKNTGIISVKTTPNALNVKIDGKSVGMSGVTDAAEFYLSPGIHLIEIEAPGGKTYRKEINVVKNVKNCICLNIVEKTTKTPCPYNMKISGPTSLTEGELATFFVENIATNPNSSQPLKYIWNVTPTGAAITSGIGSESITIDTTNLGGQTLSVSVDTSDGFKDEICRQTKSIDTNVKRIPPPQPKEPIPCDVFPSVAPDDDKARFDNCVIQLQANPGARLYIIINEGTDRISTTRNSYTRVRKRAYDYFVEDRRVDPNSIEIVKGSNRLATTYQIWFVPPGAKLPPIND